MTLLLLVLRLVTFTTPGIGDSCGTQSAVPDWKSGTVHLEAWTASARPSEYLRQSHPALPMGVRDSFLIDWHPDSSGTVCVEMERQNGLRPCVRACIPLGPPLPVSVPYRPKVWRPGAFDVMGRRIEGVSPWRVTFLRDSSGMVRKVRPTP